MNRNVLNVVIAVIGMMVMANILATFFELRSRQRKKTAAASENRT